MFYHFILLVTSYVKDINYDSTVMICPFNNSTLLYTQPENCAEIEKNLINNNKLIRKS